MNNWGRMRLFKKTPPQLQQAAAGVPPYRQFTRVYIHTNNRYYLHVILAPPLVASTSPTRTNLNLRAPAAAVVVHAVAWRHTQLRPSKRMLLQTGNPFAI